jgi:hypothetical protein
MFLRLRHTIFLIHTHQKKSICFTRLQALRCGSRNWSRNSSRRPGRPARMREGGLQPPVQRGIQTPGGTGGHSVRTPSEPSGPSTTAPGGTSGSGIRTPGEPGNPRLQPSEGPGRPHVQTPPNTFLPPATKP